VQVAGIEQSTGLLPTSRQTNDKQFEKVENAKLVTAKSSLQDEVSKVRSERRLFAGKSQGVLEEPKATLVPVTTFPVDDSD